ncbi:ABC transporter ATP-binding protein [Camelliibacillus cellulosilyticus]|uniref:ABC transporter ATP-binding protein n=1 Tax=Camelliibacillus cellulosilyticus TaxID=2174486 RepID=A0ABV9GIB9_9BACL
MWELKRFLKPYRWAMFAVLVFVFLQALSNLYLPTLMADIVDVGIVKSDIPYILKTGGWMLLITAAGVIVSIFASYLSAKIATGFGRTLRTKVFTHVEKFSLHEFDQIGTASLITRTTNDITQVQQVWVMMLRIMSMAPLMCIGGIVMAVTRDAKLSLVLVVIVPVLIGAIILIASRGVPLFKVLQKKLDKVNRVLREGLTGIRVIRAFNRTDFESRRFDEANTDLTSTAMKATRIMSLLMPTMMIVINFSTIAIIWFGGLRIDHGTMQVGDLMAFIQYVTQILFAFMMVSMMFVMLPRASVSAARISEVLKTDLNIVDKDSVKIPSKKEGTVAFNHVTFSYPGAEQPALSDITFRANPGEVTAIIGGTGSGKSTLINLLTRFYEVDEGEILIDGDPINHMPQENLRAMIGLVPQKAVLFTGTIADNIRYGKEDASDEEVEKAATIAQAMGFISEMPDRFQAQITQGGTNVSGGQKQRLAIARALVRKPEIYLFDDSFSALDYTTDAKLRAALKEETAHSTVIIVAQRVSTVMDADQIIVLDEGRIVGSGRHRALIKDCDIYREIVGSQLGEEALI